MNAQIQGISPPRPEPESEQVQDLPPVAMCNNDNTTRVVRPWVRYWARFVDNVLWGFIFTLPLGFVHLTLPDGIVRFWPLLVNIAVFFVYTFIEALLLSIWGTTPGKALLQIQLSKNDGYKPSYGDAWLRSFKVFVRGLGLGIPFITFFTLINAEGKLSKNLCTSWDQEGGFIVTHHEISKLRIGLVVLLVLVVFVVRFQQFRPGF